jgi:hypothetical protein
MSVSCTDMTSIRRYINFIKTKLSYLIRFDFWGPVHIGKVGFSTGIISHSICGTIDTIYQLTAAPWRWTPCSLKDVACSFIETGRDRTKPIAVTFILLNYIFAPIRPPTVLLARELSG